MPSMTTPRSALCPMIATTFRCDAPMTETLSTDIISSPVRILPSRWAAPSGTMCPTDTCRNDQMEKVSLLNNFKTVMVMNTNLAIILFSKVRWGTAKLATQQMTLKRLTENLFKIKVLFNWTFFTWLCWDLVRYELSTESNNYQCSQITWRLFIHCSTQGLLNYHLIFSWAFDCNHLFQNWSRCAQRIMYLFTFKWKVDKMTHSDTSLCFCASNNIQYTKRYSSQALIIMIIISLTQLIPATKCKNGETAIFIFWSPFGKRTNSKNSNAQFLRLLYFAFGALCRYFIILNNSEL